MLLSDINLIDHAKDETKGLNPTDKIIFKIWFPFLADTDMTDPFREQIVKKKVWSFTGKGSAKNSRIDRDHVNTVDAKLY